MNRLRAVLGRYDKTRIDMRQFSLPQLKIAIQRARALESRPDDPIGYDAPNPGTRVYRLMERILGHP